MKKINVFLYETKNSKEIVAAGYYLYNHLIVCPGSFMKKDDKLSKPQCINRKKDILLKHLAMESDNSFIITDEVEFTSPSLAAAVLLGKETSGTDKWKDKFGNTINDLIQKDADSNTSQNLNKKYNATQTSSLREEKIKEILSRKHYEYFSKNSIPYSFSNNQEADLMIKDLENQPEAYFIGCIMDRGVPAERAWTIPYLLKQIFQSIKFWVLKPYSLNEWIEIFEKYKLHRYNKVMAEVLYRAIQKVHEEYNDQPDLIWKKTSDSNIVINRFKSFHGVGEKIGTMAVNILYRDFKLPFEDLRSIDISPDIHVKRVFHRIGLISSKNNNQEVIRKARKMNPDFPGIYDISTWEIGRNYCYEINPNCFDCPLREVCKHSRCRII